MSRFYHRLEEAIQLVVAERNRQDRKWGSQRHLPDSTWLAILTEEVGEAAEAVVEQLHQGSQPHAHDLLKEVAHVAAVAVAWLETLTKPYSDKEEVV